MSQSEMQVKPAMSLSHAMFAIARGSGDRAKLCAEILAAIEADEMAPFYTHFCTETNTPMDHVLLTRLQLLNTTALSTFTARLLDAQENLGETEVSETLIARAHYLAQIGDKDGAILAYRVAVEKTVPLGTRIDLNFAVMRLGFFYRDDELVARNIDKVKMLIDEGGDWDRRNRLKVYQSLHLLRARSFTLATPLLLASLPTFSSPELLSYRDFVKYCVVAATLTLPRLEYKQKSPEVLEVLHEIEGLAGYANSIYRCKVEQMLKHDPVLATHTPFYIREMRITAYNQILASYRSLTLESMAKSFGVSEDFIDTDLARFIAAGRIHAVIDKVGGVVETNRPDAKNKQYMGLIKQGDVLLNRIQKLGRVINV